MGKTWYGAEDYKWKEIQRISKKNFEEIQFCSLKEKAELEWELSQKFLEESRESLKDRLLDIDLKYLIENTDAVLKNLENFTRMSFSNETIDQIKCFIINS